LRFLPRPTADLGELALPALQSDVRLIGGAHPVGCTFAPGQVPLPRGAGLMAGTFAEKEVVIERLLPQAPLPLDLVRRPPIPSLELGAR